MPNGSAFSVRLSKLLPKEGSASVAAGLQGIPARNVPASVFQLFVSIFDLPGEELEPLGRALEAGDIDFMRFPLDEVPDLSLPYAEDELAAILFLVEQTLLSGTAGGLSAGRPPVGEWPLSPLLGTTGACLHHGRSQAPSALLLLRHCRTVPVHRLSELRN